MGQMSTKKRHSLSLQCRRRRVGHNSSPTPFLPPVHVFRHMCRRWLYFIPLPSRWRARAYFPAEPFTFFDMENSKEVTWTYMTQKIDKFSTNKLARVGKEC